MAICMTNYLLNSQVSLCNSVNIDDAVGEVCAELLSPYPPGVPLVCPGELLTSEVIHILRNVLQSGGKITGASDESLNTIRIIRRV